MPLSNTVRGPVTLLFAPLATAAVAAIVLTLSLFEPADAAPRYLTAAAATLLFASLIVAALMVARLASRWSRLLAIDAAIRKPAGQDPPTLAPTGVPEFDGLIETVNALGGRLSQARRRSDELAVELAASERLAALGRIAGGVAHGLRGPVSAMRLKAELALKGDRERQLKALGGIIELIDRLDAQVARLVRGASETRPRTRSVEVAPFLASLAEAAGASLPPGVTIETRAEAVTETFDPDQLRLAMGNLLRNAIAAARPGSAISLSARREGESLVMAVHNEGGPLPALVREHLFEPFVSTGAEGAGLGLSVVREIARAHRGVARLAESDTGVTFEIALPCKPVVAEPAASAR